MPANARWNRDRAERGLLRMPVAAVGGAAPARQLVSVTEQMTTHVLPDCGHIVPLDQPAALAAAVLALADGPARG